MEKKKKTDDAKHEKIKGTRMHAQYLTEAVIYVDIDMEFHVPALNLTRRALLNFVVGGKCMQINSASLVYQSGHYRCRQQCLHLDDTTRYGEPSFTPMTGKEVLLAGFLLYAALSDRALVGPFRTRRSSRHQLRIRPVAPLIYKFSRIQVSWGMDPS
jgi:hypothetical protein